MVHGGGRDVFLDLPVRNPPVPGAEMPVLSFSSKGPVVSMRVMCGIAHLTFCMRSKAGQVTLQIDNALKWVLGHVTFVLHTVNFVGQVILRITHALR